MSSHALYLAAAGPRAGKSVVALGLMEVLSSQVERLGYFRPVATDGVDRHLELMRDRYQLDDRAVCAFTDTQADEILAGRGADEVFKGVLGVYRELAARCDFVFIEGTDYVGGLAATEFEFNAHLASHLSASVVTLLSGLDSTPDEVADSARVAMRALVDDGASPAAIIVNRAPADRVDEFAERLADIDLHTAVLPDDPRLGLPTFGEVVTALDATPVHASDALDEIAVASLKIAAMSLPNLLDRLDDGALVIAPGDRPAVLVGVLASHLSSNHPNVAGLLLTGGLAPHPSVMSLIDGLGIEIPVPIYLTERDTFETIDAVTAVQPVITAESRMKIATALSLFDEYVDGEALLERIELTPSTAVTPLMFEFDLIARARADVRHIVLPEGTDERVVRAAGLLTRRGVARLTLLGDPNAVRSLAAKVGADLDGVAIVDPATSDDLPRFADAYHRYREHRGVTPDIALERMRDVSYFGTMMVQLGEADGMVSGAAHTTAHTIAPAFEFVKTKPGVDNVSSVFLMSLADRVLVYGDCAIIPNPTPEQLADIAISSAETARTFGIEPRVAMLSYSTGTSGAGEDVERVAEATRLVRERAPLLEVEGPIQYDAAVDASVGATKLPESSVAGRATVFIFPDLNTGNNTYKAVQRSAGAVAIGPVLQGLNKPVNDLSRGALVADIVNTVAITAIQAQLADGEAE